MYPKHDSHANYTLTIQGGSEMTKKLKVSMLLLLVVVMLLGNATCAYARGMVCDECSNGTLVLKKTEYIWKETGVKATCDDCGSIRRQLQKYSVKTYRCNGCGALQDFESKMSNTMWACECDE